MSSGKLIFTQPTNLKHLQRAIWCCIWERKHFYCIVWYVLTYLSQLCSYFVVSDRSCRSTVMLCCGKRVERWLSRSSRRNCLKSSWSSATSRTRTSSSESASVTLIWHYNTCNNVWAQILQCESKKIPPYGFLKFFPKRLGIFNQFLHTCYVIISTLDYKFLFN